MSRDEANLGARTEKKFKASKLRNLSRHPCQSCHFVAGSEISQMTNKPGSKTLKAIMEYCSNADDFQSQSPSARQSDYDTELKKPALRNSENNASLRRMFETLEH